MPRTDRTQAELVQASEHLHYEINTLIGTTKVLASGVTIELLSNALLESFAIHIRVLDAFFYGDKRQDTDVVASDFIPDWSSKCPTKPSAIEAVSRRVNKEIAHLTYDRLLVTPEAKGWDVGAVATAMFEVLHVFVQAVPDEVLGPKMTTLKSEVLANAAIIKQSMVSMPSVGT